MTESFKVPYYRKKPPVVQAFQITKEHIKRQSLNTEGWPEWLLRALGEKISYCLVGSSEKFVSLTINIGESDCRSWFSVSPGDWIIRDALGELYPCSADVFEATYEAVE